MIRIIGIKEELEEDQNPEEEAYMEHVFTMGKKVIEGMNIINTKE